MVRVENALPGCVGLIFRIPSTLPAPVAVRSAGVRFDLVDQLGRAYAVACGTKNWRLMLSWPAQLHFNKEGHTYMQVLTGLSWRAEGESIVCMRIPAIRMQMMLSSV